MSCRHFVVTSVPCAVLQQPKHQSHRFKRTIYNYEKLDKNKFCSLFQRQNWEDILETRSNDQSARMFTKVFMDSAQELHASKIWLLPYACCGLHFIDSAAGSLSCSTSPPLHYIYTWISVLHLRSDWFSGLTWHSICIFEKRFSVCVLPTSYDCLKKKSQYT